MTRRVPKLFVAGAAVLLALFGVGSLAGMPTAGALPATRFVAPTGSDASNTCLVSGSPCKTLGHALAVAVADETVQLEPGTYSVASNPASTANAVGTAQSGLTIQSDPSGGSAANTIVDATGKANGLVVNANGVTVKNLTVRNADLEGVLVIPPSDAAESATVTGLTLSGNVVTSNNLCRLHPTAADCPAVHSSVLLFGRGVQLTSVVNATVNGNTVTGNWGGIDVNDAFGPSHGNTISGNTVTGNGIQDTGQPDRTAVTGISLSGTSSTGVGPNGTTPSPTLGGVFSNTVSGNTVNGNGSVGIAVVGSGGRSAAYGNTISANTVNDNWGVGIAVKSAAPLQDVNGNVITGNHLSNDGLHGSPTTTVFGAQAGPGDIDAGLTHTAGVLVLSETTGPGTTINGTVVTANVITNVYFGVVLSARTLSANVSGNVIAFAAGGAAIHVQRNTAPIVGIAPTPSGHGYWQIQSDGTVFPFGDAGYYGSLGGIPLARPVVGIAATPTGRGYWAVATDGGIFSFGDARFFGSTGAIRLNQPIVGMASAPSGTGYWLVASDGGIFSFGAAKFHGSTGAIRLNQPVVGMAAGPSGTGYWLVARDGGIFAFGSAAFHGSTGAIRLNQPVVGMSAGPSANGYWLVASDGGIFAFGSAKFHGSAGAIHLNQPVVGMAATPTGLGYWLSASDGGIFTYPDAHYYGAEAANPTG